MPKKWQIRIMTQSSALQLPSLSSIRHQHKCMPPFRIICFHFRIIISEHLGAVLASEEE
jgi:hypothetical protein